MNLFFYELFRTFWFSNYAKICKENFNQPFFKIGKTEFFNNNTILN